MGGNTAGGATGYGWDAAEQRSEIGTPSIFTSSLLKNDKDKIVGCFVGEPLVREVIYDPKTNRNRTFTEEDKAKNRVGRPTFAMQFYIPEEQQLKVHVMSNASFKDVIASREKYGSMTPSGRKTLDFKCFEIKRHGAARDKNTVYKILPENPIDLSPEHRAILAALPPIDLHEATARGDEDGEDESTNMNSHKAAKATPAPAAANGTNGHAAAAANGAPTTPTAPAAATPPAVQTISEEDRVAITNAVKAMKKEAIQPFLDHFAVKTIRAIPLSRTEEAKRMAGLLPPINSTPAPAPAEEEIDAFA